MAQRRALLIDTDPDFQDLLGRSLAPYAVSVYAVTDGLDGLGQVPGLKPELIIVAVELPDKYGYFICNQAKKGVAKKIPVVLTTATVPPSELGQHRKLKAHADEYIDKRTVSAEELVSKIDSLINLGPPLAEVPEFVIARVGDPRDAIALEDAGSEHERVSRLEFGRTAPQTGPPPKLAICLRCFTVLEPGVACDRCAEMAFGIDDEAGFKAYQQAARALFKRSRLGGLEAFGFASATYGFASSLGELIVDGYSGFGLAWLAGSLVVGGGIELVRRRRRRNLLRPPAARGAHEQQGTLAGERTIRSPLGGKECLAYSAIILTGDSRMVVARDAACAGARVMIDAGGAVPLPRGRLRVESPLDLLKNVAPRASEGALAIALRLARELVVTVPPVGLERCLEPGERVAVELDALAPYRTMPGQRVPRLRLSPAAHRATVTMA